LENGGRREGDRYVLSETQAKGLAPMTNAATPMSIFFMGGVVNETAACAGTASMTYHTGTSEDSGTCGGYWAVDVYTRNFSAIGSGTTYTVTEKFASGVFSTIAGDSPGKCNATPSGFNTVNEGIQGKFSGQEKFTVTNGTLDVNGSCVRSDPYPVGDGLCHTDGWVLGFFGPSAVIGDVLPGWSFKYKTKGALSNAWTNADVTVGGNIGPLHLFADVVTSWTCRERICGFGSTFRVAGGGYVDAQTRRRDVLPRRVVYRQDDPSTVATVRRCDPDGVTYTPGIHRVAVVCRFEHDHRDRADPPGDRLVDDGAVR
jgi:hypothetical protein